MAKKNLARAIATLPEGPIHTACVIHGDAYSWDYVEKLHSMLSRHITPGIVMHVFTEAQRYVPPHMVKHELINWGIGGPRRAWWYKMQMFNPQNYNGPLLYFDLDVVITKNIDWIWHLPLNYFWGVRDFKYLWRPAYYGLNSSVMWWHTAKFKHLWTSFQTGDLKSTIRKYQGDQDYLTATMAETDRRYFSVDTVKSWRWQALDGGYNFARRAHNNPGAGTMLTDSTSILVFHGHPKPSEVDDPLIKQHWQ